MTIEQEIKDKYKDEIVVHTPKTGFNVVEIDSFDLTDIDMYLLQHFEKARDAINYFRTLKDKQYLEHAIIDHKGNYITTLATLPKHTSLNSSATK